MGTYFSRKANILDSFENAKAPAGTATLVRGVCLQSGFRDFLEGHFLKIEMSDNCDTFMLVTPEGPCHGWEVRARKFLKITASTLVKNAS